MEACLLGQGFAGHQPIPGSSPAIFGCPLGMRWYPLVPARTLRQRWRTRENQGAPVLLRCPVGDGKPPGSEVSLLAVAYGMVPRDRHRRLT